MRLIVEHEGDTRIDGFESRDLALDRHPEYLSAWPGRSDKPMSHVNGVDSISRTKLDLLRVRLNNGGEIRLPNVQVVDVTPEDVE